MSNFSDSQEKIFLEWLETKANSLRANELDDQEFISEIEWILDTPKAELYLNYLDSLSSDELIARAIEAETAGKYPHLLLGPKRDEASARYDKEIKYLFFKTFKAANM